MRGDDIEHLKDWDNVPFSRIAMYLLNNGRRIRKKINGVYDELLIKEKDKNWIFVHEAFPEGEVRVSVEYSGSLTPGSVIP